MATILSLSRLNKAMKKLKYCLRNTNANAEAETSDGWTALLFVKGQEETVKILLDRIKNVNSVSHKNACGKTIDVGCGTDA